MIIPKISRKINCLQWHNVAMFLSGFLLTHPYLLNKGTAKLQTIAFKSNILNGNCFASIFFLLKYVHWNVIDHWLRDRNALIQRWVKCVSVQDQSRCLAEQRIWRVDNPVMLIPYYTGSTNVNSGATRDWIGSVAAQLWYVDLTDREAIAIL